MARSDECPSPYADGCRYRDAEGDCHCRVRPRPCESDGEDW
jgi:hypothetical protein